MKISIIIPTCNRNDLLSECLQLLWKSSEAAIISNCEVLICDDSSNNIARNLIESKFSWAKWLAGPKKGPAANRNFGASNALGEWLLFLDDDCLPQLGWLETYLAAIVEKRNTNVFEGFTNADRPQGRFDEEAPINTTGDKLWSCNFLIRKAFFYEVGTFDETFPYAAMEDTDFQIRVLKLSKVYFLIEAKVIHPWRRVMPFSTFNKHLKSHIHFSQKYKLGVGGAQRLARVKIFVGSIFSDFNKLVGFSMKGTIFYIEKCLLNFCLIFI